ncbi:hypothetical protein VP395_08410 [Mariniflexile soesokkakense]|uniref:Uncharacterized protein n=1 Tax=Mariniflexile soesokkakense TaxID=1343160 RepID=A0ABV0AC34_9FLAO
MNEKSINPFIIDFNKELEKVKNKEHLIQNEIIQIEVFTSTTPQYSKMDRFGMCSNKTNSVFDLSYIGDRDRFNKIYFEYLIYEKPELSEKEISYSLIKSWYEQAKYFAEYYTWLKELQKNKASKTESKKANLSHKQKMLALYYLGLDLNKYDNVKTAKILSQIIDQGEENTRKYLSYVSSGKNEVRTKNNLEKISQLFENVGITEVSTKINLEIEKIK